MPDEEDKSYIVPAVLLGAAGAFIAARWIRTPAIDYPPNGRHLTVVEKFMLAPFKSRRNINLLTQDGIDSAILYFSEPMPQLDGYEVEAYTDQHGIHFPFKNREMKTARDLGLLGHEMLHWCQYLKTGNLHDTCSVELPAYQLGMTIWEYYET